MGIEIKELLIKVIIEEPVNETSEKEDMKQMKRAIIKECKNEIKKQFRKIKER